MTKTLIIDDKSNNLISISTLLKNLLSDNSIITASSGLEGIKKAKKEQPDLSDPKGKNGFYRRTCSWYCS